MNIKDIEAQSGMTRANIRFYEQEGLLTPQRLDNGYRSYSEEDLATLQRIRLPEGCLVRVLNALPTDIMQRTAHAARLMEMTNETGEETAAAVKLLDGGTLAAGTTAGHWNRPVE